LTVNKAGLGQGRVRSRPPGLLDCGAACASVGPILLQAPSLVELVAEPLAGFQFAEWIGCDFLNGTTCSVNVTGDRTVTARFEPVAATFTLTVAIVAPPGSPGSIVGSSTGNLISCPAAGGPGAVCSQTFPAGSVVQVRPGGGENGAQFGSWSGCDTITGAQRCNVTLNGNRTVTATFVQ
jgi:hypothetical protein